MIILKDEILSDNWYTLRKVTYQRDETANTASREVYDRGNGATILLYNRQSQTVILTRQFRMATYVNGNTDGLLIECCAGLLDKDNPADCIRRETEEETGYRVTAVKKVFEAYMSPGSVTELLYYFVAEYTSDLKVSEGGGLQEESEDIEVLEIPFAKALDMMETGEIKDGKTIMLLQYAVINGIFT